MLEFHARDFLILVANFLILLVALNYYRVGNKLMLQLAVVTTFLLVLQLQPK